MSKKLITTAFLLYAPMTHAWFVSEEPTTQASPASIAQTFTHGSERPAEPPTPSQIPEVDANALLQQLSTHSRAPETPPTLPAATATHALAQTPPPPTPAQPLRIHDLFADWAADENPAPLAEAMHQPEPLPLVLPQPPRNKVNKKDIPLTQNEADNEKYTQAVEALKRKEYLVAEAIFHRILQENPTHILSRVQLAKLYILKNEYLQAETALTPVQGLFMQSPEYIQTLALVYEHNGKKIEALSLLNHMPTQYRSSTEYNSLLASLYQQTGNHRLAKHYYQGLLTQEPENTRWLLGMSITLDTGGETQSAVAWYQKVLDTGNIDPNVMTFIKNRLTVLYQNRS